MSPKNFTSLDMKIGDPCICKLSGCMFLFLVKIMYSVLNYGSNVSSFGRLRGWVISVLEVVGLQCNVQIMCEQFCLNTIRAGIIFVISFMLSRKQQTLIILPCRTQLLVVYVGYNVLLTLTLMDRSRRKLTMNWDSPPRTPAAASFLRIPYFQAMSYAFCISENIKIRYVINWRCFGYLFEVLRGVIRYYGTSRSHIDSCLLYFCINFF